MDIPAALDTPECREAIYEWLAWRKKIKKPYKTDRWLRYLEDMGPERARETIAWSLKNEYQGLWPPSQKGYKTTEKPGEIMQHKRRKQYTQGDRVKLWFLDRVAQDGRTIEPEELERVNRYAAENRPGAIMRLYEDSNDA